MKNPVITYYDQIAKYYLECIKITKKVKQNVIFIVIKSNKISEKPIKNRKFAF
jgi:hypothetical protein